jgi:hypothetical protein
MNLNFPTYYTTERPFKNLFRFNSGFYSTFLATPWITSNQYATMPKDADGYPLEIPYTDGGGTQHIVKTVLSDNGYYPQQRLVVLYEGAGTLNCTLPKQNETPGRFEIVVNTTNQILFDIVSSTLGNHIRNIRVLRMADEGANLATAPFHTAFLDKIAPFKCIRFMNWMKTNGSTVTSWSQRTPANWYDQSDNNTAGVAYEYLVELCNITQKDAWICIPHQATNAYMTQMAAFFKNNLNPSLHIWIEYSNEVWNWGFPQSNWVTDNGPSNISYPRRYVERAMNLFSLFETEFGGTTRLRRVLGTQLTNTWVGQEILAHADPTKYDFLSPTGYFSYSGGTCGGSLNASSTALDVINCSQTTFRGFAPLIRQDYWNAKLHRKQIVNYEAGNHMTEFNPSVPYAQALRDAQTNPAIYTLYKEVADSLRLWDSRMIMYFVLASRLGTSVDVFGHLDDIDQVAPYNVIAPKYQAIIEEAAESGNACLSLVSTPLPLEIIDFEGILEKKNAVLTWRVASESNLEHYLVEKSEDGIHFSFLKKIKAKNQNAATYILEDAELEAGKIYYYRLTTTEKDGRTFTSKIVVIKVIQQNSWSIHAYPNPSSDGFIHLDLLSDKSDEVKITLFDQTGRVLSSQQFYYDGNNDLSISLPTQAGFYLLKINYLGEEKYKLMIKSE